VHAIVEYNRRGSQRKLIDEPGNEALQPFVGDHKAIKLCILAKSTKPSSSICPITKIYKISFFLCS